MSGSDPSIHDEFYQSLLGDFLGESEQLLVAMNETLLRLDEWVRSAPRDQSARGAEGLLADLFRSAHSLKGLSNMLGLEEIENLILRIESVVDAIRKNELAVAGDVVELLFEAIDRLGNLIDALKDVDAPAADYESLLERIDQLLRAAGGHADEARAPDAERALRRIESQVAHILEGMGPSAAEKVPARPATDSVPLTAPASQGLATQEAGVSAIGSRGVDQTQDAGPLDGIADDVDFSSRFIAIFIDETEMSLDHLTKMLLAMEAGGEAAGIRDLLVIAHRIKGSAASVGLNRVAKLAHLMEDFFQDLTSANRGLSADATDVMLRCMDELRRYVESLKQGSIPRDRFAELAVELLRARQGAATSPAPIAPATGAPRQTRPATAPPPQSAPPPQASASRHSGADADAGRLPYTTPRPATETPGSPALIPISDHLRQKVLAAAPLGLPAYAGVATFQANLALVGLKAELLHEKLLNLGDVCYFDPPPEQFDAIEKLDCVRFGLATERPEQHIHVALKTAGVIGAVVECLSATQEGENRADPLAPSPAAMDRDHAGPDNVPPSPSRSTMPGAPAPEPASAGAAKRAGSSPAPSGKPTETLRVDVERLDQLMNLAGQLVVSKARLAQVSELLRSAFGNKRTAPALDNVLQSLAEIAGLEVEGGDPRALAAELGAVSAWARRIQKQLEPMRREVDTLCRVHASINELDEAVHQLDRVADEIQKNVMDTRMVPIGPLFTRFHRVVRDIIRSGGKTIRLVIRGDNTELDKRMIDELGDPLIHLVRNSADHGIEPSDVRLRAGKPAEGTITLEAANRGNSVLVRIIDDGRGLDTSRILSKAIEKKIVAARDADRMSTQQIHQLIWQTGLSTAEQVTDVSGRGMGMDIVRSRIESLNGSVEVESEPGVGTTVTIKLPLTLAILPSLMVEIGGDVFAMPLESVAEVIRIRDEDVATVHGKRMAQVRGRVVSVLELDEVFQWRSTAAPQSPRREGQWTLAIVEEGEEVVGLAIDRVIGEEDVVIKSMADNYRNVPGIAGASVLGNGRVSLILDMAAVMAMASRPHCAVTSA